MNVMNSLMRMVFILCVIFVTQLALAQTQPVLNADSSIDQILDALDRSGNQLQDFVADVTLTQTDARSGDSSSSAGKIWFQRSSPGQARIRVSFDTETVGNRQMDKKVDYLLDNGWLWERDYRRKTEIKRQVLQPGQKMNLLKLGEGPFPLPIGQDKAEVHRQFDVQKIAPKEGSQRARTFSSNDVWVDPATQMPRRIEAVDANETTVRTTDLTNLRMNQGLAADAFTLPPIDNSWNRHEEPFSE
jgi:outer membrane lipoprotein-sorting protein